MKTALNHVTKRKKSNYIRFKIVNNHGRGQFSFSVLQKETKSISLKPNQPLKLLSFKQQFFKRVFDIIFSLLALIFLFPVFIFLAICIKVTSYGSVLYQQERIGKHGKQFMIFKFRTMYMDAEKNGPDLARNNDKRITKFGKILRKTRLDELPQFYNVLRGDMAIVGPRPEREFYINQILQHDPSFLNLLNIKPGITSLGQIKFGYAQNVTEMLERLKFDLFYIENISLFLDFKILILTIKTLIECNGK